jgi:hypothetical protein
MTSKPDLDDLDAVRTIVNALQGFDPNDQERVLRWAREKLGLSAQSSPPMPPIAMTKGAPSASMVPAPPASHTSDIKTFLLLKDPKSDLQFAAVVAYFYKFEAAQSERKSSVTSEDLQEACRKAGRQRHTKPAQTLVNAHAQGYLDKAGERGAYSINTVGENLVAMTLPGGKVANRKPRARSAKKASRRTKKGSR